MFISLYICLCFCLFLCLCLCLCFCLFLCLGFVCNQILYACGRFSPGQVMQHSCKGCWLAGWLDCVMRQRDFLFSLAPFFHLSLFPFLTSSLFQRLPTDQIAACPCFVFHLKFRCESCINLESKRSPTLRRSSCWETLPLVLKTVFISFGS